MSEAHDTYGMSARDARNWKRRREYRARAEIKRGISWMVDLYMLEAGIGWRTENKSELVRDESREDRFAEYQREYRARNRERRNAQSREWYAANSDTAKQSARDYRKSNPDARREYQRKWRASNKEKVRGYLRKQRARNRWAAGRLFG